MDTKKVILSVIAGLALGTAFGVLFAPDKGSNTRKKIAKKKNGLNDMLEKKFTDFSDLASKKYDDANDTISRLAKNDSDHQELRRKEANSKETK